MCPRTVLANNKMKIAEERNIIDHIMFSLISPESTLACSSSTPVDSNGSKIPYNFQLLRLSHGPYSCRLVTRSECEVPG
jgi:hypothetical protein